MGKRKYDGRKVFNGRSQIVAPNPVLLVTSRCVLTNLWQSKVLLERNSYFQEMTGRTTFKICILVPLDLALSCKNSHVCQLDCFQGWKELSFVWATYLWFWVFLLLCFPLDRKRSLGLRSKTLTFPATVEVFVFCCWWKYVEKTENCLCHRDCLCLNAAAPTTF